MKLGGGGTAETGTECGMGRLELYDGNGLPEVPAWGHVAACLKRGVEEQLPDRCPKERRSLRCTRNQLEQPLKY